MLYLKYRPQTIEELDNSQVRQRLGKIVSSGPLPHAFLFTGPHGTGKTSAARIIAKIANCEKLRSKKDRPLAKTVLEPCNACSSCQSITAGSHLDVIEIDAASNRGIDEIRDLREKIKLAPSLGGKKVYIVDEVHMLTREAFNALLKTLEEPPPHAMFILATTEAHRLPKTILSRCLRIEFKKADLQDTLRSLKRLVQGEGWSVKDELLRQIAKQTGGHLRDAQKLLEQTVIEGGGDQFLSGLLSPIAFLKALLAKDAQPALIFLEEYSQAGQDLKYLIRESLETLRQLILSQLGLSAPDLDPEIKASGLDIRQLTKLMTLLNRAGAQLKNSFIASLPLELAIVEWCFKEPASTPPSQPQPQSPSSIKPQARPASAGSIDLEAVKNGWPAILESLKPRNHSVVAFLRAARPALLEGHSLICEVLYKFHKERLESPKIRLLVEKAVLENLGLPLKLRYKLVPKKAKTQEDLSGQDIEPDILTAAQEIFGPDVIIE